jgi:hypothetical protein
MSAVALGLVLLAGFVAYAFVHCMPGEFAAAVGSIFGGIVGAGGAIAAVYLLINQQRAEDEIRISGAVTKEIIVFTKIIIESLKICRSIKAGRIVVQKKNANSLMTYAEPIIYKGVADRIGLYPHGQAVVEFYTRVILVQAALQVIVNGPDDDAEPVTAANAETIAKPLIIACQCAKIILNSHVPRYDADKQTAKAIVAQIEATLQSAKECFHAPECFP